jgi:hypothetical protein
MFRPPWSSHGVFKCFSERFSPCEVAGEKEAFTHTHVPSCCCGQEEELARVRAAHGDSEGDSEEEEEDEDDSLSGFIDDTPRDECGPQNHRRDCPRASQSPARKARRAARRARLMRGGARRRAQVWKPGQGVPRAAGAPAFPTTFAVRQKSPTPAELPPRHGCAPGASADARRASARAGRRARITKARRAAWGGATRRAAATGRAARATAAAAVGGCLAGAAPELGARRVGGALACSRAEHEYISGRQAPRQAPPGRARATPSASREAALLSPRWPSPRAPSPAGPPRPQRTPLAP